MASLSGSDEDEYYENSEKQKDYKKGKKKIQNLNKSISRLEFELSHFHAIQVPKGWNKLFICMISVESGKTIRKSGKATVHNGECHWQEDDSFWISQQNDDIIAPPNTNLNHHPNSLIKLVLAMGSARFGTLGEVTVDLANYMKSDTPIIASLPLKNCQRCTILQVKIQCLSPKRKIRDEHLDEGNSYEEETNVDYDEDEEDNKSDASDNTFSKNIRASDCNQLQRTCHPGEFSSNETSLLASGSHQNLDSLEGSSSFGMETFLHQIDVSSFEKKLNGRKHSSQSKNGPYPFYDASTSVCSFSASAATNFGTQLQDFQMEDFGRQASRGWGVTFSTSFGSSKDLMDAAEVTIKLLYSEAKMWEKNARKLIVDVERMQKDLSSRSKNEKDLEIELLALKEENAKLKTMLEESVAKQIDSEDLKLKAEEMGNVIKELRDEIEYQKGLNKEVELQLKKTQECNIDLGSVLEELEETIEKQRMEILELSVTKSQTQDTSSFSLGHEDSEEDEVSLRRRRVLQAKKRKDYSDSSLDISSSDFPIKCLHEGIELQEFWNLELQNQQLLEKQKNLESTIEFLEKSLAKKDQEMIKEKSFVIQTLEEKEEQWKNRLFEKEQDMIIFEKKLYEGVNSFNKEINALRPNLQELEEETSEIEVSELKSQICKLEEEMIMNVLVKEVSVVYLITQSIDIGNLHYSELEFKAQAWKEFSAYLEGELKKSRDNLKMKELSHAVLEEKLQLSTKLKMFDTDSANKVSKVLLGLYKQLQFLVANLSTSGLTSEISEVEGSINLKELSSSILTTILRLKKFIRTLATTHDDQFRFHDDIQWVSEPQVATMTSDISEDSLDCMKLPNWKKYDSEIQIKGGNLSEPENAYNELDFLSGLEAENLQLSERIFVLEAVLRHLTNEKELTHSRMKDSEILAMNLQAEIGKLEAQIEAQNVNMKKQCIQSQEEINVLKLDHLTLQATNQNLIETSESLEKANGELRLQNSSLHKYCAALESELSELRGLFSGVSEKVEDLQHKLSSILEEIDLKEKTMNADLDALVLESKKHKERLILEESLFTQMYLEKTVEVGKLQREVSHLRDKMSGTFDQKERRAGSDIVLELHALYADKAILEAGLQEFGEKEKQYETKLNSLEEEYETNVQKLTEELAATTKSQEILIVNCQKVVLSLESVKSNEEKLKSTVRRLEMELKASEFEKQQVIEDFSNLKAQLQKTETLQDEVLSLKKLLSEAKFEYSRLETLYQMLSAQYEESKAEKIANAQRSSTIEKVTLELEDYKRCKANLEEKVLRLEWDLIVKEASCHNNAQLRCQIGRMRIANNELKWKIRHLQQEKEVWQKKFKALEEDLKQKKDQRNSCGNNEICEITPVETDKLQTDKYPIPDTISCQKPKFSRDDAPSESDMCNSPAPERKTYKSGFT